MSTSRSGPTSRVRIPFAFTVTLVTLATAVPTFGGYQSAFSQAENQVTENMRTSKAWQRAVWAYEQRAYPGGYIPSDARTRAVRDIAAYEAAFPQRRGAANWKSVGPSPLENRFADAFTDKASISGRVAAVAVNPRKSKEMVIGAAQGGLHLSKNNGKTWKSAGDDLATLAFGAIAYAPSNTKVIYAASGEAVFSGDAYAGVGVYKSTNGGNTWKLINTTDLNGTSSSTIVVHPRDPDTVMLANTQFGNAQQAAKAGSGVYKSTDGGVTWVLTLAAQASHLVVDPKDFNTQYAAAGNTFGAAENGVYRSTDGGLTWTKLSGPWNDASVGRVELAIAPSDGDVLYVGIQDKDTSGLLGLFKTTNASARDGARVPSFEEIAVPALGDGHGEDTYCGSQCWYDHVLLVDPKKSNVLWAGGIYLWKLTGKKWTLVLPGHVDVHALAFAGKTLISGNDGGVFSSKNGKKWKSLNDNLTLTQFYHGAIREDSLDFMLGGAQDNGTSVRDAGNKRAAGDAWSAVFGGDGADTEVSASNPDHWLVSSQNLFLVRTLDGGQTGTLENTGINTDAAPFISVFAKCAQDDDVFVAGTDRVWKSTNFFSGATATWKDQGPKLSAGDTVRALAFAPSDPKCNTIAMGTAFGEVYYTKNGGKKWNNADKRKQVPRRSVTDIAFDPDDKNMLWVTLSGFEEFTPGDPGHVFRTTNANKGKPVWKDVSPPVNLPMNTIVIQPGNAPKAWVGSDIGLWEQIDNARGAEWSFHGPDQGMPNVAVFDLQANELGVAAFTHGRSAFVLTQSASRQD